MDTGDTVQMMLGEYHSNRVSRNAVLQQAAKYKEAMDHCVLRLQERIRAGETTGNRFIDHVLLMEHDFNPKRVEAYERLEAALHGRVGQPVLVSTNQHINYGSNQKLNSLLLCGIVSDTHLILNKTKDSWECEIPCRRYFFEETPCSTKLLTRPGPLPEHWMYGLSAIHQATGPVGFGPFLRSGLTVSEYFTGLDTWIGTVFVGDEEVTGWLAEHRADRLDFFKRKIAELQESGKAQAAA